jgi:hypothetical protein
MDVGTDHYAAQTTVLFLWYYGSKPSAPGRMITFQGGDPPCWSHLVDESRAVTPIGSNRAAGPQLRSRCGDGRPARPVVQKPPT